MINFYTDTVTGIKSVSGSKPIAVAPFYNAVDTQLPGWVDAQTYGAAWQRILDAVDIDVVSLQDGVGAGHATPSMLAPWFSAMQQAIANSSSPAASCPTPRRSSWAPAAPCSRWVPRTSSPH
jgi:hypothetical protein